ncbi:exported hypothetical protein [Candidatus Sulfopaludibacter sp. SbA3]|nr:exported hypothetical protein [Candidatus Sulfopaludibacter sp. SbA3]
MKREAMQNRFASCNILVLLIVLPMSIIGIPHGMAQNSRAPFHPAIPKTWDDSAMATLEVPLVDPAASPKHVPADYYYRIPVRSIYRQYPVYAPGREPRGYMEWLERQDPVPVWDGRQRARSAAPNRSRLDPRGRDRVQRPGAVSGSSSGRPGEKPGLVDPGQTSAR